MIGPRTLATRIVATWHIVARHRLPGVPSEPPSLRVGVPETRQVEQEVVRRMRAGDRVQSDDARRRDVRVVHVRVAAPRRPSSSASTDPAPPSPTIPTRVRCSNSWPASPNSRLCRWYVPIAAAFAAGLGNSNSRRWPTTVLAEENQPQSTDVPFAHCWAEEIADAKYVEDVVQRWRLQERPPMNAQNVDDGAGEDVLE